MLNYKRMGWFVPASAGLGLGIAIGSAGVLPSFARPALIQRAETANPQERTLDANLYMQTSAEYRACCLQAYGWMTERLRTKLAATRNEGLPPAVIMDLDETVLDNASFQSFLDRERLAYSDALWDTWEKQYPDEVRLVPGAKAFIEAAEGMGITVVYITNRLTRNKAATVEALKHNGLNTENIEERLLLKEAASDKTVRRQAVEQKYRVLFLAGDNLRDFAEEFIAPKVQTDAERAKAMDERAARVDKQRYRWGTDWFILPNPVYGEWQRLVSEHPHAQLRTTSMQMPAGN
jgi:5'-nucleotidase (lipoprotein e(P4) family)